MMRGFATFWGKHRIIATNGRNIIFAKQMHHIAVGGGILLFRCGLAVSTRQPQSGGRVQRLAFLLRKMRSLTARQTCYGAKRSMESSCPSFLYAIFNGYLFFLCVFLQKSFKLLIWSGGYAILFLDIHEKICPKLVTPRRYIL